MIGTLRAPAQDAVRRAFEIAILRGAKEQAVCGGKMRRWQGASPA